MDIRQIYFDDGIIVLPNEIFIIKRLESEGMYSNIFKGKAL